MSDERPTVKMDPRELLANPSWGSVAALAEQVTPGGGSVIKLGLIARARNVLAEMEHRHAPAEAAAELRVIADALAALRWSA